jgi:hypothetical protein
MIEYVFFILLVALSVYPQASFMTPVGKVILLAMTIYVTYHNVLLGVVCGLLYIQSIPKEGFKIKKRKTSRLPLDETMRPKNSNRMKVSRPMKSPNMHMQTNSTTTQPNTTGKYTPF